VDHEAEHPSLDAVDQRVIGVLLERTSTIAPSPMPRIG
jgi:hypothetical protein